jgi:DNA-binding response OmpR family regulator
MTGKILVIDDDIVTQRMLLATLTKAGYSVILASDGNLGIQAASSQLPDLIILDIVMPGKDGIDVASFLGENPKTRKIPIIFLSVLIPESGRMTKTNNDMYSYLSKPYNENELLSEVKRYLSEQTGQNRPNQ